MYSELSNGFVMAMGMGTTFIGLIAIIFICKIMSFFCVKLIKPEQPQASAPAVSNAPEAIPNKQEMIAAVSAVIAEELGTSASNIRIHSFKKM